MTDLVDIDWYLLYENINSWYYFEQSKEECEYMISLAKPHMKKSTVVDSKTGRSKDSRSAFPTPLSALCDVVGIILFKNYIFILKQ